MYSFEDEKACVDIDQCGTSERQGVLSDVKRFNT